MVAVDAQLQVQKPDLSYIGLQATDLGVLLADPAVTAALASILAKLGAVTLDAPTLAALETINAIVAGTVAVSNFPATQPVSGPLTDAQLRAATVPVSGTVATGGLTDTQLRAAPVPISGTVSSIDAAEIEALIGVPFTVTASGVSTLVAVDAAHKLRLRRLVPTLADPDGSSNPLLTLKIGATEVARGYVLSGRFNVLGALDADLTLTLSKAGDVSGTAFYTLET